MVLADPHPCGEAERRRQPGDGLADVGVDQHGDDRGGRDAAAGFSYRPAGSTRVVNSATSATGHRVTNPLLGVPEFSVSGHVGMEQWPRRPRRRRVARPRAGSSSTNRHRRCQPNRLLHRRRVVARIIANCGTPTGRTFDFTRLRCRTGYGFPATAAPEQQERGPLPVSRRPVVTKGINNGRQLQRVLREMHMVTIGAATAPRVRSTGASVQPHGTRRRAPSPVRFHPAMGVKGRWWSTPIEPKYRH